MAIYETRSIGITHVIMLLYVEQELTFDVEASEVIEECKIIEPFHRRLLLYKIIQKMIVMNKLY